MPPPARCLNPENKENLTIKSVKKSAFYRVNKKMSVSEIGSLVTNGHFLTNPVKGGR